MLIFSKDFTSGDCTEMPLKPNYPPVYSPNGNSKPAQPKVPQHKPAALVQNAVSRPVARAVAGSSRPPLLQPKLQPGLQLKMQAPKPQPPIRPKMQAPKPTSPIQPKMAPKPQAPKLHPAAAPRPAQGSASVQRKQAGSSTIQRMKFGSATNAPNPDKLEYDDSSDGTTGMMVLLRGHDLHTVCERTFVSGGGYHAEEKAILYLQGLVNAGTITPQHTGAKDYIVYLALSKSPCSSTSVPATRNDGNPGCLERLNNLDTNGLTQGITGNVVTFAVQLSATKPYQPKIVGGKAASTGSYNGFGGGPGGSGTFGWVR